MENVTSIHSPSVPWNSQPEKSDRQEFTLEHTLTHLTPEVSLSCQPTKRRLRFQSPIQKITKTFSSSGTSSETLFQAAESCLEATTRLQFVHLSTGSHVSDKLLPLTSKRSRALAPRYRSDLLNTPHLRCSDAGLTFEPSGSQSFQGGDPTLTAYVLAWTDSRDAWSSVSSRQPVTSRPCRCLDWKVTLVVWKGAI